ncbi:MAG: TrkA family potassium uptake protein [Erysipelotrichaceae bacterium]|nr:TrkA family potassium uptake protein [Erysipelotrichaceae bacterium]
MANQKQVAVLGLGVFGNALCQTLEDYGVEVLAIDIDPEKIDHIMDHVTKAVIADVTDRSQLVEAGIQDFDTVVVSLSSHFEESVLCTLILKELNIPRIIAKAPTNRKKAILERVGADEVINSDRAMAIRLAKSMLRKSIVESVDLDEDYSIVEINVLNDWIDKSLIMLNLRRIMGMNVIAIKSAPDYKLNMDFTGDYTFKKGDHLIVVAKTERIEQWDYLLKDY